MAMIPSIMAIQRDKRVHGFSIFTPIFFTSWGWWNIAYYPHLDQFYSTIAAAALALVNSIYLVLVFKYRTVK